MDVSAIPPTPITVTLLLAGGHQYTLPPMEADHPMLKRLFASLTAADPNDDSGLFEMVVNQGEQALYFPGKNVVGLFASPPMQLPSDEAPQDSQATESLLYQEIPDFLPHAAQKFLFDYVAAQYAQFETVTPDRLSGEYRHAMVLSDLATVKELVKQRIQPLLPELCRQLQLDPFSVDTVGAQLLARNHGHFSAVHRDDAEPGMETCKISWLYYFYDDPPAFSGGELLLYDTALQPTDSSTQTFKSIVPRHNSIIFFPGSCWHTLMPISCPSETFEHSQFVLKGWLSS